MTSALYTREILRLAAAIPHHRRLGSPEGSAERRAPLCGSRVIVDVILDPDGRVAALGQEVKACALGQASAALMGAAAIGRGAGDLATARDALAAWLGGAADNPGLWPGLAVLAAARDFPARHGAILLPFDAVAAAAQAAERP